MALTALRVQRLTKTGKYPDGDGLYLRISDTGTKSWLFRYQLNGRRRWQGLGPFPLYSLADARAKALDARRLRHEGIDPIDTRRAQRASQRLEAAKAVTFRECAVAYIKSHRTGWDPKHAAQWETSLETYAYPVIGSLPVGAVNTALVLKVIEPHWSTKNETMARIRGRLELVLDYAKTRGHRDGAENPARWKGHLAHILPAKASVQKEAHHKAMPYAKLPAFMAELRAQHSVAARCLEFIILTGVRRGEAVGARWGEIQGSTWVIPAERMKGGVEHRVPLSGRALEILKAMQGFDQTLVFPDIDGDKVKYALQRMKVAATTHGFRSTFKDWCAEQTNFQDWVSEKALAHLVGDETRRAYQRGDLLEKRRELMAAWAAFIEAPACAGAAAPREAPRDAA